jgi:hypothetical protein
VLDLGSKNEVWYFLWNIWRRCMYSTLSFLLKGVLVLEHVRKNTLTVCLWVTLLVAKYFSIFFLNTLGLAFFIFLGRIAICLLVALYSRAWYSLIFFLIYVGGILVLFIYISSLKFNPVFSKMEWSKGRKKIFKFQILLFLLCVLIHYPRKGKGITWLNQRFKEFRYDLFKNVETLFLIRVGALLLFVLWAITKITFRTRACFRPFFRMEDKPEI